MKKNLITALLLLANVTLAGTYFFSCQRDADQPQVKPLSETPVGERSCLDDDYCSWVITATSNCSVVLCGDILLYTASCSIGCSSLSNDHSANVSLTANTPHAFCVRKDGSVCVHNPSTATQAITVDVQVAGTAAITVTIPIGETRCFNSRYACDETFNGCI